MFSKLLHFLATPIRIYREEKQLDREVVLSVVGDLCSMVRGQQEVMQQQGRIVEAFLKSFASDGNPESRVVRNEDEVEEALSRWNIEKDDLYSIN